MSKRNPKVSIATMIECIRAAHLSVYLESPFNHGCGMFLVGNPGTIKTTLLEVSAHPYDSALVLSDVNSKTLNKLKGRLTNNSIRTLFFTEYQKLSERDPRTALNVEGTIRQLVEEGAHGAGFDDSTIIRFTARASVIGAMTEKFRDLNWERWTDSGFARRFLWCLIRLETPEILNDSVEAWVKAEFITRGIPMFPPENHSIPNLLTRADRKRLRPLVRHQPAPANVAYEMLCRIAAVLEFYYQKAGLKKSALETVEEFGNCVVGGADLTGLELIPRSTMKGKVSK